MMSDQARRHLICIWSRPELELLVQHNKPGIALTRSRGANAQQNQSRCLLGILHPILWLLVLGIINLFRWVDGGFKVIKQGATLFAFTIDQNVIPEGAHTS